MGEPLIHMAKAAKECGIPYPTMLRLVRAGRLPSVRFGGIRRCRLSEIRSAIEELGARKPEAPSRGLHASAPQLVAG
jgi:excisionase family DNA binding protein